MYIPRDIETHLKRLLHDHAVIILLGARQVGKTTMLEPFVRREGGLLLNCDITVDRARLSAASALAPLDALRLLGNPALLVIDEAQRFPEIGRIVKGWYDAHIPSKIVLLGSSSLNLLDATAEPLTGRNEKLYLTPLLFTETLQTQTWYSPALATDRIADQFHDQIQALLLQRMVYGNYPAAVTAADAATYLVNLTADYLLQDVLYGGLVRSPRQVRQLLELLAYQIGSEVSVSELSRTSGLSRPTVENYLDLLERTYIIFRLPAFSTNQRKEIAKGHKIFFWDTGVRNALLNDFSLSPLRADMGALFEAWAIAEVAKRNLMSGSRQTLYFWRKAEGSEVDLIVKGTDTFRAYEFKWSKPLATRASHRFADAYGVAVQTITRHNVLDILQ